MRTIIAAALIVGLVTLNGCGDDVPPPQTPPPPPPSPPAALAPPVDTSPPTPLAPPKPSMAEMQLTSVKAVVDALNAHDAQKYAALFAADALDKGAGEPDASGRDTIATRIQQLFTAFPDFKIAVDRVWQKGNLAVASWGWTGTDTGGFMGAKPTGRPAGVQGASLAWYNDDGLIKELHRYDDVGTVMNQLDPKAKKNGFRAPPTLASTMDVVTSTGAGTPDEDKTLDVAKAAYTAVDNKKEADVLAVATDDTVIDDYTMPTTTKGLKDWKAMYKTYTSAFPDFKQMPMTNQVAVKDYVVSEGVLSGTHKGALGPLKATGKPVSIHFVDITQWKDGKLTRFQTWANSVELLTEIGIIKPPGAAAPAAPSAPAAPKKK
jgi:steroid delta-isomerase-like uncharacterized protein